MITLLTIAFSLPALFICLQDWRKGLFISVLAGFFQDPLRKVMEGQPIGMTILVAVFVAFTFIGARIQGERFSFEDLEVWRSGLRSPLKLFFLLVVIQSLATFVKTGNIMISGIGLIAYLSPVPAMLVAYYYCRDEKDITKFLEFYLLMSVIMVSGVYLSYAGFDWEVLSQVGSGIIAYASSGELILHSGFMRAPEIAAWHAGAAVCLIILLFVTVKRKRIFRAASAVLILLCIGAIILTGRRKILMEVVLFISFYGCFLAYFRRGSLKLAAFLFLIGVILAVLGTSYVFKDVLSAGFRPYLERGNSVRGEATERLYDMTIGSFKNVLEQNGILGAGAGIGSQGAQHFGIDIGNAEITGVSSEGGLGKVLAELGLPGLILFLWVAVRTGIYLWNLMAAIPRDDSARSRLVYGLISFLLANTIVFAAAHQVFGDPFVLLILGWILGFVFAIPKFSVPKGATQQAGIVLTGKPMPIPGFSAITSFVRRVRW